ncbi:hypothetical protein FRC09_019271 [Ceratobasidium sp. 395]|nr:hypothetical protein FRC09_019271 [Ceratobasidium sp. 395]
MYSHNQNASDEAYLLRSTASTDSPYITNHPQPGRTSWRSGVTISVFALACHIALGLVFCALAIFFGRYSQKWSSLHPSGPSLPLLTARYLNFALDIGARVLSLTLEGLLAVVALRTATSLWTSSRGVKVADALTFNLIQLEVTSIFTILRTRISWTAKISYAPSIAGGLTVYIFGSIMFGYVSLTIPKAAGQDILVGNNQMFIGSNVSGSYTAPDYNSLVPSNGATSPFTTTVLHTLMGVDLSRSNESISSFNLAIESGSTLLLRNITTVLVNQTVSTQLVDCQPLDSTSTSFGFTSQDRMMTSAWQNIPSSTIPGVVNQLAEYLDSRSLYFGTSSYQTSTFIMTLQKSQASKSTPADESQVLITLVSRGTCASDPFQTAFGPMSPVSNQTAPILDTTNNTYFLSSHATLACRNTRTVTRTVYSPDGAEIEHTSESFYAKPVLSTVNRLYMYTTVDLNDPIVGKTSGFASYGGIGSLSNNDMIHSSAWQLPSCAYVGGPPADSTELEAISVAWSRAVARVQHYETSILAAFVKQDTEAVSTPVVISVLAYRLAIIPGALFAYGLSMAVTACVLTVLLIGMGEKRGKPLHAKSLSVWRITTDLAVIREGGHEGPQRAERSLKRELGTIRIRSRAQ